jgi:hypothetical protein
MGWRKKRRAGPHDLVTASELACFAYCPEQWRLEHGLGLELANRAARAAGTRHHAVKAAGERVAGGSILLGWIVAAASLLMLLLWLAGWR